MVRSPRPGDRVAWHTSQGETHGRIVKGRTSPTRIKGHEVEASASEPRFIVERDKTGARAAHKAEALKKR